MPPLPTLTLRDFDYHLPPELIAQHPVSPRDQARLLVVQRNTPSLTHDYFYNLRQWLQPGDVLVVNNSKVIPARLFGKKTTGGQMEIFLVQQRSKILWEAMVRGKGQPGLVITLEQGFTATLRERVDDLTWLVAFNKSNITSIGTVPLPPYITEQSPMADYQTVYAKPEGSVAAPTAGLHFTERLLDELRAAGVIIAEVTLHVGLGTFAPVKVERIEDHVMHKEYAILPPETATKIAQAHQMGHRVIAVGTTACRTLEAFAGQANRGWVNIFIRPGYKFNTVDGLITNFHLPKSTLLMLVAALATKPLMDEAYRLAVSERYRFFSFGDAMLII